MAVLHAVTLELLGRGITCDPQHPGRIVEVRRAHGDDASDYVRVPATPVCQQQLDDSVLGKP